MGILREDSRLNKSKKKCKTCGKNFRGHDNALYCKKHGESRERIRKKRDRNFYEKHPLNNGKTWKEIDKLTKDLIITLKRFYKESLEIYEEWLPLINPKKYATPSGSEAKNKKSEWIFINSEFSKAQIKKELKKYRQPSEASIKDIQKIRRRFGLSTFS